MTLDPEAPWLAFTSDGDALGARATEEEARVLAGDSGAVAWLVRVNGARIDDGWAALCRTLQLGDYEAEAPPVVGPDKAIAAVLNLRYTRAQVCEALGLAEGAADHTLLTTLRAALAPPSEESESEEGA